MNNNLAKLWKGKFMKENIVMSALLAIFLFPSLGFIKPFSPLSTAPIHKSVVWGFNCKTWYDENSQTFLYTFNTYSTAQNTSSIIRQHGYTVDIQKNPTKLDIIRSSFDGAEIFFYIGHGAPTALALSDENCKFVGFSKDTLSKVNTSNLRFVLLSACETGKDTNDPNGILRAFKDTGATKVIGFNRSMNALAIKQWSEKFWKYAFQDDMEVSDAAHRATNEMAQNGIYTNVLGWNTDSLVILGTDPLYLGYKPSFPDFSQGWELFLQDLWNNIQTQVQQFTNQLLEKFNAWWADEWSKIQKSITEWLQDEFSKWFEQFIKELEKIISQTCFQPVSMLFIFAGVLAYQKRHRH